VIKGLDSFPAGQRPTIHEVNVVHLAWDVMVGIGTLLMLLSLWYGLSWLFRRDYPKQKVFLWFASAAGVLSIMALEAGWVVTEVGRQPWIVSGYMKVDEAATGNEGVWVMFLAILGLYIGVGVTLILILRKMSRRFREEGEDDAEVGGPYGPRAPLPPAADPSDDSVGAR
jgi:cytochrome d ubiquinol oxidase subunit I